MRLSYPLTAVDVDSGELLALEASYGRSSLNALSFLRKALRMFTDLNDAGLEVLKLQLMGEEEKRYTV
jgi:transposase-like protein